MTSPIHHRPIKFKSRYIAPVNQSTPCFLDLSQHRWHILVDGRFRAAFSNFSCAEMTADHDIYHVEWMDSGRLVNYIKSFRIVDIETGMEYARTGTEWIPFARRAN